jgi:predicted O-methyltransferase YrrM
MCTMTTQIDGVTFEFGYGQGSTIDRFLIRKPPTLIDMYEELALRFNRPNIVELGIAAGGSTALLALLFQPRSLVALELDPTPVPALAELAAARDLPLRAVYGIDQADRERVGSLVGDVIDLVIDDASHLYEPTLASFEVLFPRLRPGGLFIVEDWAADFAYAAKIDAGPISAATDAAIERRLQDAPPLLPRIAAELVQACGASPGVVGSVTVNRHWIIVERGGDPCDGFKLADLFPALI